MELFCACFCIYGKNSEDWYQYWSSLSFDPASDQEIDDLIHDVRTLVELLHFPEDVVLATLKNKFPQQRMHFFNVNDVQTMYRMFRAMFPRNRNQASNVQASSGASPFAVVHTDGAIYSLPHKDPSLPKHGSKHVQFDKTDILDDTVDKLRESVDRLAVVTDKRDHRPRSQWSSRNDRNQKPRPYKPYISRNNQVRFQRNKRDRNFKSRKNFVITMTGPPWEAEVIDAMVVIDTISILTKAPVVEDLE